LYESCDKIDYLILLLLNDLLQLKRSIKTDIDDNKY